MSLSPSEFCDDFFFFKNVKFYGVANNWGHKIDKKELNFYVKPETLDPT